MGASLLRFKKIFACFMLPLLILAGCTRASTPPPTPDPWTQWPAITAAPLAHATPQTIATRLFGQYLEQFRADAVEDSLRLADYKILQADLPADLKACAADLGIAANVEIHFGVLPAASPNPAWSAGSGTTDPATGWIADKIATLALYQAGDSYTFKSLGAPPCAGIAIDGSRVRGPK